MIDPRVALYQERHQCRLIAFLGAGPGQDGFVLSSDRATAVKFFDRRDRFARELDVYITLTDAGIFEVAGHNVPSFYRSDKELLAIEMTIVDRPYVLDFAGARLEDEIPDFEDHVIEEHHEHLRQLFDDRWMDALHVAEAFRQQTGFVLLDIHPGNIAFVDEPNGC